MKKTIMITLAVVFGFLFLALIGGILKGGPTPVNNSEAEKVEPKREKYIASKLPEGVTVYGFNETFDKPYGKYDLSFTLKNSTNKKIEYPQIDVDLYVDGKLEGTATGGPGKLLENGDIGTVSISWILPKKVPDSVVFKWIELK
jgi:hypothetical protein